MNPWNISEQAARLHQQSLVADMTMPMVPGGRFSRFFHTLDAMRRSGVKYVTLTVASDYTGTQETMRNIRLVRFLLLGRLGKIRFVRSVEDITQAARQGKLAVGLHFQGTAPVGDNLAMVEKFYKRGITGIGIFLGNNDVSTENYVRNIDYVVQMVGAEHVGIGLDYVYDMEALINFARNHPEQYPKEGGYFEEIKQVEYAQLP